MAKLSPLELRLRASTLLALGIAAFAVLSDTLSTFYFFSNVLDVPTAQLSPGFIYLGLAVLGSNFILTVAVFFLLIIATRVRMREIFWRLAYERLKEGTHPLDIAVRNHVVSIENLNVIFSEFANGLRSLYGGEEDRTPHLGLIVNRVKAIFDRLSTSGQSAVCIKLLRFGHDFTEFDGPYLWTAARDDISSITRSKVDHLPRLRRYRPDENKAFSDIMSRQFGKDYFASNDLKAMGRDYFNSNPHWTKFYNASVVVPIKPCREDVSKSTIGFLCVDSLHGKLNEEIATATLVVVAEILYLHIQNFPETIGAEPPD